ncbi:MAG: Mut7-C RNAse domain-containing protein [Acidilobaceae archaeon]|nr:Mut7-C RNAse domain-containing protein [Acidilobaceae archaeon]
MKKFIADTMLGDLARWLRIMGYDVAYSKGYEDEQILEAASLGDRIIITRDRRLYAKAKKASLKAILVESTGTAEKIAEVVVKAGLEVRADPSVSRCPECNKELSRVEDKEAVKDKVPPLALKTYKVFYVCSICGSVYWEGSHWNNIRRTVELARRLVEAHQRKAEK